MPCLVNKVLNNLSLPSNFHRYFGLSIAHLSNISAGCLHKSSEKFFLSYIFRTFSHSITIRHAQSQQVKRGSKLLFGYKPTTNIHSWYFTRLIQYTSSITMLNRKCRLPQHNLKREVPSNSPPAAQDLPPPDVNTYITLIRKMKH